MQGMVVAEDVYTEENQMILAHGMVLTPGIICQLQEKTVDAVKICEDCVSMWEYQPEQAVYQRQISDSEEYRRFIRAYRQFIGTFEAHIFQGISNDSFSDTDILVQGIREICQYSSDKVHILELLLNLERSSHSWTIHSINVAILCYLGASEMELGEEEQNVMLLAGLFHDIGRIVTPDIRIRRPDRDTFENMMEAQEIRHGMRDHIRYGYDLLKAHGFDERICNAALYHHERMDGSGYLEPAQKEEADLYAKMTAIADQADMTVFGMSDKIRKNLFQAISLLEKIGARKFDRKLLRFCIRKFAELYLHRIVVLSNGIRGEIVAINRHDLGRPIVKTQYGYIDLGKTRQLHIAQLY